MTAEATGVKKMSVTFNKAVDTTKAVITVKKGVATITSTPTFAADAKSAELALGSKITKGTYTVTVTGLDEELSADVVAEDEKLTTFQLVGNNLVASAEATTVASISFKALNQYEEMMAPNSLQVSSTFATDTKVDTQPSATKAGVIKCSDITPTLAIPGTVGTIVIVDSLGTNLNAQVTYQSKAYPKTAEVIGIYNEKTEKVIEGNLKKGDKISQYKLMLNIKDQYGTEMTAKAASASSVTFNPAPIMTDLTMLASLDAGSNGNATDITYNGANNVLVSFAGGTNDKIVKAGSLNLTIVGMGGGGVLAQPVITVDEPTVVTSISVAPATALYAGQKNDLVVEAYDANGNAVTSYDALNAAEIRIQSPIAGTTVTLNKNSDGTGKFVMDIPEAAVSHASGDTKYRNSLLSTLTIYANVAGNANYLVKTQNVTIWEKTRLWEVTGKTKDTVTAAASGTALTVDLSTLTYADQYGNSIAWKDITNNVVSQSSISYLVTGSAIFTAGNQTDVDTVSSAATLVDTKKIQLVAGAKKGTTSLYLKVINGSGDATEVSADKYDLKLDLSVVDGMSIDVSDVEIASVNNGKTVYAATSGSIVLTGASVASSVGSGSAIGTEVPVVVTATVNGKKVILDPSQYTITNAKVAGIATSAGVARQTVKKTVNVVVESENGALEASKEFEISNEDAKVVEIKAADSTAVSGVTTGAAMTASSLGATFKFVTQYGEDVTAAQKANALYYVTFTGDKTGTDYYTLTGDKTQNINVDFKVGGKYTATVKVVLGDASFEQNVTIEVATS